MPNTTLPTVSVIVPVYNVEQYLEECVDSILAQTYPNLEIILVDDGTPDSSGEICDRYAVRYPDRIKVIHKPNGGLSSARNAGLDIATGRYVAFVDSDDKILPEMYAEMVEAMERTKSSVVASRILPGEGGDKMPATARFEEFTGTGRQVLSRCLNWLLDISAWSKLYLRSAIGDQRFTPGITNEDFPFISELFLRQDKVHVMGKGYYLYRYNPAGISKSFKPSFFDIFTNLDYVRGLLPDDDTELRDDFERYELQMHIFSGLRIVRCRKNREYKAWLRKNRAHIRRCWRRLLFDRGLSMRWRLKAAAAFLHVP